MSTCPHCTKTIPHDSLYCPYCRNDLNAAPQARSAVEAPQSHPGAMVPQKGLGDDAAMRLILPVGCSGWAIGAGYAGLFGLLIFPAPLALGLGIAAAVHLKRNPKLHGWGRTIFGIVVGVLGTLALAAMGLK